MTHRRNTRGHVLAIDKPSGRSAALLTAVIVLCALEGCVSASRASLTVHYFPLEAETLTAITPDNITKRSRPCTLVSSNEVEKVTRLLDAATPTEAPFADMFVRLRVDIEKNGKVNVYALLDKEGNMRGAWAGVRRLSPEPLRELVSFIEGRCS
jgi:hypothetical protein